MRKVLALLAGAAVLGPSASADDLILPPWDRGDPMAAYQEWRFDAEPMDLTWFPEVDENPFGDPWLVDFAPIDYFELFDGRTGVFCSGLFRIMVPNIGEMGGGREDIYVQITWNSGGDRPVLTVELDPGDGEWTEELDTEYALENNWMYSRWHIQIVPIPAGQPIQFWPEGFAGGGLLIDQLIVDNIPEPTTLSLLALGGLAVMRRRR